ncbi:SWR1-complex protein 4 isoform X3 [Brassica napus]|uniref:SWR1-complex protein 4 isoform X3 n=1 Tax=Brassica napus TaxID=3708 RepID=UPI002078C948|nr:SWR1-complex protein 4 isoform X3 [Brassica napus]
MGGTDAKDILGLPKTPLSLSHEKKARPQKESHRKPDGISREVYALTGGVAPLMPSIDVTHLKRPPPPDEKVAWQWLPIKSSARKDDLQLYHWVISSLPRAQSPADLANHPLMKEPYDMTRDRERKRALSMVLSQSRHQEKKDAEILAEAKRITEMRLAARRAAGPDVSGNENIGLDKADGGPASPSSNSQLPATAVAPSTLTMADYASTLASLRMLHVYLRTYGLEQMVQAASSAVGLRTIKRVEQTLQDLGVNLKPKVPTKTVCDEHLELRKEILTLLNLQKQLQYKESEGSSQREGSYAAMPDTPKDRVFASEPFSFGGISAEKPIKKEPKRKGPGRQADTPSPAHKRPRKLKASDL